MEWWVWADLTGGTFSSSAFGVSGDGSTIVGISKSGSGNEAFRWTSGGGMMGLGDLPGGSFFSRALGVSGDGSVVVGSGATASGTEAFIWDGTNGLRSLQEELIGFGLGASLTGWQLEQANSVSSDGLIVAGFGINPSGDREAWVANLEVPKPGSILLIGIAVACLGFAFYRRRM